MGRNEIFSLEEIHLPRVRCEEWLGFVFLTLDANIPVPADCFNEITALVHAYELENYVESFRNDLRWEANWKLVAENFMESYHLPRCHSGTVGGGVKLKELQDVVLGDGFNYHRILRGDECGLTAAHPDNKRLDGKLRQTTWVLAIYPSLMITLTPGYFWYLCISPDGPRNVDLTFGGGMAPEYALNDQADRLFAETRRLTSAIVEEDSVYVERVFRGLQSSLAEPGPLSHLAAC